MTSATKTAPKEDKTVGRIFREVMINRIKESVENNSNLFMVSYSNVSCNQISSLRKDLKKTGAQVYVTRNSIVRLAFKDLKQEELAKKVEGQTALIWSNADSVEVAKILVKFSKDYEGTFLQGGLLEDRFIEQNEVKTLADLPSKSVLQSQLLAIIQAPVTRLLGAMNAKSRDLLSILKQLSEKKGGS